MSGRLFPALVAILLGVIVGALSFVPFVAVQYRRVGRLTAWQGLLWAGFVVYGLALWTYTLLPLPDTAAIRCLPAQLRPFNFIDDILDYPAGSAGQLVRNPAVMQVALNVMLFVPLGFFVRAIWRRGFLVTTLAGLAMSLMIEVTQHTGVYGVYPCAYRLFDVDDLLANTTGALLGGLLSVAIVPWLARRDEGAAPLRPRPVTFWRRLLAMFCDVLAVWLLGGVAGMLVNLWRIVVLGVDATPLDQTPANVAAALVPLVLLGALVLGTGRTVGDHAVLLRWEGGKRPEPVARTLRYLGGIGGWQLLTLAGSSLDLLFVVVGVVMLLTVKDRGGLPGVLSGMRPVDVREPDGEGDPATGRGSGQVGHDR